MLLIRRSTVAALSWLKLLVGSWFKSFRAGPGEQLSDSVETVAAEQLPPWPLPLAFVAGFGPPCCGWVPFPPLLGPRGVPQRRDVNGGYPLHRLTPLSPPLFRLAGV